MLLLCRGGIVLFLHIMFDELHRILQFFKTFPSIWFYSHLLGRNSSISLFFGSRLHNLNLFAACRRQGNFSFVTAAFLLCLWFFVGCLSTSFYRYWFIFRHQQTQSHGDTIIAFINCIFIVDALALFRRRKTLAEIPSGKCAILIHDDVIDMRFFLFFKRIIIFFILVLVLGTDITPRYDFMKSCDFFLPHNLF